MTDAPIASDTRAVLACAAADGLATDRAFDDDRARLAYLLDQLDTCVLARSLTLQVAGSSITLDVAGRALLRLTQVTSLQAPADIPIAQPLGPHDIPALAHLLQTLARQSACVTVSATPLTRTPDPHATGIPARDIAVTLGLGPKARPDITSLRDHLLQSPTKSIHAHRSRTTDWQILQPDHPDLPSLTALADALLSQPPHSPLIPPQSPLITPDTLLILTPKWHLSIALFTSPSDSTAVILDTQTATQLAARHPQT